MTARDKRFEFLEHTADVKFKSYGSSLEKAFQNAALALKKTMAEHVGVREKQEKSFEVEGMDREALLRDFLEEFLYLLEGENFLLGKIKNIEIEESEEFQLKCVVSGDKASNYDISNPVKAVTYNDMFVKKVENSDGERWVCQVVLDV